MTDTKVLLLNHNVDAHNESHKYSTWLKKSKYDSF